MKELLGVFILFFYGSFQLFGGAKIKGISFVGANQPIGIEDVKPIVSVNANWVTIMPYGFVGNDGAVKYNSKWQWWGEKEEGVKETIRLCQNAGLKVMLKPQIWMMNAYTGDYKLGSEKEWLKFELSYQAFIKSFLTIAIEMEVPLFCIGTEWREFVKHRGEFWNKLIKDAKEGYTGKLVYAASWDDYQAVPFWNQVDYIGVNGYFPISRSNRPELKELITGWEIHRKALSAFSDAYDKKIIFTEIGYRSMDAATVKPWEHKNRNSYNEKVQSLAYQALFKVIWEEDWFAGMFIWKWYHNHKKQGGNANIDFTPQNKQAEETIRTFWK